MMKALKYLNFICLSVALVFFAPTVALATVTLTGASGYSAIDLSDNQPNPIIYGGTAGTCTSVASSSTCNSCTSSLEACNPKRIHDNLELTLTFTSSSQSGDAVLLHDGNVVALSGTPSKDIVKGGTSSLKVLWSTLCELIDDTNCDDANGRATFQLGIDSDGDETTLEDSLNFTIIVHKPTGNSADEVDACDNDPDNGICSFSVYPGDEKVYIENPGQSDSSKFPINEGLSFSKVRVFFSDQDFASVNPLSDYADIRIGEDSSGFFLEDKTVTGLSNLTPYCFRIGLVDPAGNISHFTSDDAINFDSSCNTSSDCATNEANGCPYAAMPDRVLGLLTEDFNCFISTVAYGSSMADQVKVFREFRNKVLLQSQWGVSFVKAYYKYGAYASQWIKDNEILKASARVFLWPLVGFAELSLRWGLAMAVIVSLSLLTIPILLIIGFRRKGIKPHHAKI